MKNDIDKLLPIWRPHDGQRAYLEADAKFKVLACGRRWGKTDACAASILLGLMKGNPTDSLIVAPTLDQAKLLFERVREMIAMAADKGLLNHEEIKVRTSPYPSLTYGPHRIKARSGHLAKALRGNEATNIIVDEAAFVPEEVITEVVMPMLATTDGSLTLISTPCGRNHFYRFFEMGTHGENGFWSRTAPSSESPFVRPGFLEVQRELISERAYLTEYEAQFMDSAGRVFRTEDIDRCLVPKLPREPEPMFYFGVDWARYRDFTTVAVICGNRQDAMLVETDRFNRMNWSSQIDRIVKLICKYPVTSVLCDVTGLGDFPTEALRERVPHCGVAEYLFTSASKPKLINGLEWIIENGNLRMTPNPILQKELEHFESTTSDYGNTKFESHSGFHDDMVIAVALAVHQLPSDYRPKIAVGKERTFDVVDIERNV